MSFEQFLPISSAWFKNNLGAPTPAQAQAWPAIKQGKHVLVAAPTGSGKTLAAFYASIDDLIKKSLDGSLKQETYIVYISPLKALSNDIKRNLHVPLEGIERELSTQEASFTPIKVDVRTGDTTSSERQKMLKTPPHILITTPESLYLLLTSERGRKMLSPINTVIIDEIHALLGDKRGSHLALSIERLAALTGKPLQRIGLSATQKPIDLVAKFLVGNHNLKDGKPDCTIVDTGYKRKIDLRIEIPKSPLSAVMSNEIWTELYARVVELVAEHRTTLIFVNTRRLAERLAFALGERIGHEHVSSHHGSMSKEHRHNAEQKLKAGQLKVLVATASMELGIDIGSVDLVLQFSSPKTIAAFMQRVGRSGHYVGGTPKGILFPLTRDDLVEGAALLDSIRRGELDKIIMPECPLDILSQQIVAEVSCQEWSIDGLYDLCRQAYPFRDLTKETFMNVVHMVSEGFTTRRGRRGAYLHFDAVNGKLRARRGARLTALTNGGAIPDTFDYEVVLQPEGITVGTLNEDFALETVAGDIFILGNHAWKLVRIEGLKVIVHDAKGQAASLPFWLGESTGRSFELSFSLSRLRATISGMLDEDPLPMNLEPTATEDEFGIMNNKAVQWLVKDVGLDEFSAQQLVLYLWMGKIGLGVMPTMETIVMERFFDEAGDMHIVIHSPYGSRLNRGWGLSLRKKFCKNFNFELQAAATEDSIILSLSSSHSFPVDEVSRYLNTKTVRETLIQAMLDAPLFEVRWRWNATRALAIIRNRGGQRVPPYLQRMQAEDLVAQVFPDQIACFENIQGERQIPDHPLVSQAIHDCLTEAMDIEGLEDLIGKIQRKEVGFIAKDLREPSIFAQEVINARPYAFLDDTEFAERRVNAIKNRGWLDPAEAKDLSRLDPEAIKRVKEEAWPQALNPDELHDTLMIHGFILEQEGMASGWGALFEYLINEGRAVRLLVRDDLVLWSAVERLGHFQTVYKNLKYTPSLQVPATFKKVCSCEDAMNEIIRGRLEALAIVTEDQLAQSMGIDPFLVQQALLALEHEGFVFRGKFTPNASQEEWCERRLLFRINKYTIESLRQSIQPVSVQDYMRFLFAYHKMRPYDEQTGPLYLQEVINQLEGFEAPAASWETDLIPARIKEYDPAWLDMMCMSGKITWGRFNPPRTSDTHKKTGPIKSTPIGLLPRGNVYLWQKLAQGVQHRNLSGDAQKVYDHLIVQGASFFDDIVQKTKLLKAQVEESIAELVNNGLIVSDSYAGLRALLVPSKRRSNNSLYGIEHAGRWSLMPSLTTEEHGEPSLEELEKLIFIYLKRWGVLFRTIIEKESLAPPWRVIVRVLRRMELRGQVRGGRFVSQVSGEQYALAETIDYLRKIKKSTHDGELISISAADPLNLIGVILPGKKISNISSNRILFKDGIPIAVFEGKEVSFLVEMTAEEQWKAQKTLIRRNFPPKLLYYLGRK